MSRTPSTRAARAPASPLFRAQQRRPRCHGSQEILLLHARLAREAQPSSRGQRLALTRQLLRQASVLGLDAAHQRSADAAGSSAETIELLIRVWVSLGLSPDAVWAALAERRHRHEALTRGQLQA